MAQPLETLVARLEAAVVRLEGLGVPGGALKAISTPAAPLGAGAGGPSVKAFDDLLATSLTRLVNAATAIGGPVEQSTRVLESAFKAQRTVILAISQCKAPDMAKLQVVLGPLGECMAQANAFTEGKRTDAFNQQKAVAESLQALSWVAYTGKDCGLSFPAPHVEESWSAAEFYNNKAMVQFRGVDEKQVEWCKALKELFVPGLRDYVKQYQTTGPAWNPNGMDVAAFKATDGTAGPPPAPAGGPPPPPPRGPPPPPPPSGGPAPPSASSSAGGAPSMSKVFAEINQGEGVTKGLKKVTDDMKTKNRADRTGAVPAIDKAEVSTKSVVTSAAKPAPKPVFQLQQDRKWVIENHVDRKDLIVSECNSRQSVYIFGCKGCVIQVQGKVNNITLDTCSKTAIVFQDIVAAFEIVNCTSVEAQAAGAVPTIAIDKTAGCLLYLNEQSLGADITMATSSEINISTPGSNGGDPVEHALPEQFLNKFQNGQWVTVPVKHSGA